MRILPGMGGHRVREACSHAIKQFSSARRRAPEGHSAEVVYRMAIARFYNRSGNADSAAMHLRECAKIQAQKVSSGSLQIELIKVKQDA